MDYLCLKGQFSVENWDNIKIVWASLRHFLKVSGYRKGFKNVEKKLSKHKLENKVYRDSNLRKLSTKFYVTINQKVWYKPKISLLKKYLCQNFGTVPHHSIPLTTLIPPLSPLYDVIMKNELFILQTVDIGCERQI